MLRANLTKTVLSSTISLLLTLLVLGHAAYAGPVSGTIYDTDYLKAQLNGFQGMQYPRFHNADGSDAGQMIYSDNDYPGLNHAFVVDMTTGAVTALTQINISEYQYTFSNLSPGTHTLLFVEPNRNEVYKPSSKRITITVPSDNTAVTNANFNLVWNWRFANLILDFPTSSSSYYYYAMQSMTADFLDKNCGWVAINTDYEPDGSTGKHQYAVEIYHTTNGGTTWTKIGHIDSPVNPPSHMWLSFGGMHFSDATHGILIADASTLPSYMTGRIYTTQDGGKTWTMLNYVLPTPAYMASVPIAWDRTDPKSGVLGAFDYNSTTSYVNYMTLRTHDGGQTWATDMITNNTSLAPGTAIMFDGGNYAITAYGGEYPNTPSYITINNQGWEPLIANPGGQRYGATEGWAMVLARPYGQSALLGMRDEDYGGPIHTYRTDDGGVTWNRVYGWNGVDAAFSFCYDLLAENGVWMWSPFTNYSSDFLGHSLDGGLSAHYTGVLKTTNNAWGQSVYHYSADIHTAREVMWTGQDFQSNALFSFSFDEEPATGPARLLPTLSLVSGASPGTGTLTVNLLNVGGDFAKNVTLIGIYLPNGTTISFNRPDNTLVSPSLPWNLGAIPPASAIGSTSVSTSVDTPELSFSLGNLPASGTITLTGYYNNGQYFSVTQRFPVSSGQTLWNLTLNNPNQTVKWGTAGTAVFTGTIQNTDSSQMLTLNGDVLTTGVWDSMLTLTEDPAFTAFRNSVGALAAGNSYTGPLFDVTYTVNAPLRMSYDGAMRIDASGNPSSLLVPFTLSIIPNTIPVAPTPIHSGPPPVLHSPPLSLGK